MAGNQVQVDFAALQSLTNFTDNSQHDQANTSLSYSQRSSDTMQAGLAGTVRSAALAVGQDRDDNWQKVHSGNQVLVENNGRALNAYGDGQDGARSAMGQQSYGTTSVINP